MKPTRHLAAAVIALCAVTGQAYADPAAYTDADPSTGARITLPVKPGQGLPVRQSIARSNVAPVTRAFTSTGCTTAFTPAFADINVSGWGTFVATWQLYRSFDGGTTLLPITAAGTTLYQWTAPASESAEETEYGVQYYACVTSYTSGTLNVRISQ